MTTAGSRPSSGEANERPHWVSTSCGIEYLLERVDPFRKRKREAPSALLSYTPRKLNFVICARDASTCVWRRSTLVSLPYAVCCEFACREFACRHLVNGKRGQRLTNSSFHCLSHFVASSRTVTGSMATNGKLLNSLLILVLAGPRPIDSKSFCPSGDSTNSANSAAAFGWGALRATPMPCGRATARGPVPRWSG